MPYQDLLLSRDPRERKCKLKNLHEQRATLARELTLQLIKSIDLLKIEIA